MNLNHFRFVSHRSAAAPEQGTRGLVEQPRVILEIEGDEASGQQQAGGVFPRQHRVAETFHQGGELEARSPVGSMPRAEEAPSAGVMDFVGAFSGKLYSQS